MRSHQRKLMLVIAILTIAAFVFLYNRTEIEGLRAGVVASIYGRALTQSDLRREVRGYDLAVVLGLSRFASLLNSSGGDADALEFAWNVMVLRHEARNLCLEPADEQVQAAIEEIPAFQSNGQFDFTKYQKFLTEGLGPRGFTPRQMEDIVRDSIKLDWIQRIIASPVTASRSEVAFASRVLQKVTGKAILFPIEAYAAAVSIDDEQLRRFYDSNRARFNTPELRTVRYAAFSLTPEQQKLSGPERTQALQKIADLSNNLAEAAAGQGLEKAAAASGVKVQSARDFDYAGRIISAQGQAAPGEKPDASAVQAFAPAAFTLTREQPVSGVIESGETFYIIELSKETPAGPMAFEEARLAILKELKQTQARSAMKQAAGEKLGRIRDMLGQGKTLDQAAAEAGVQMQAVKEIAPALDGDAAPEQRMYANAMVVLKEGEMSGMRDGPSGSFAVFLERIAPLDEKTLAEQSKQVENIVLQNKKGILFFEWLRAARASANIQFAGRKG